MFSLFYWFGRTSYILRMSNVCWSLLKILLRWHLPSIFAGGGLSLLFHRNSKVLVTSFVTLSFFFVFNFFLFFFSNMYLRLASNVLFIWGWPSDPPAYTSQVLGLQAWSIPKAYGVLGIAPRSLLMPGKHSTPEPWSP